MLPEPHETPDTSRGPLYTLAMEDDGRWNTEQLVTFVQSQGYPQFSARQLKRFRQQHLVPGMHIEHLGFGAGTRTTYDPSAGPQIVEACRLLSVQQQTEASAQKLVDDLSAALKVDYQSMKDLKKKATDIGSQVGGLAKSLGCPRS